MVKIIPWADRKLTKKNLAKIWNLFPNDEICMIDIPIDYEKLQWAKIIARYYILRGKDFSIEIDPVERINETEEFVKLGCRKFYFTWNGVTDGQFFSAMETISYAINLAQRYKDIQICIIYIPLYDKINVTKHVDWLETSMQFLSKSIEKYGNIRGRFRRCHPWYSPNRIKTFEKLEQITNEYPNIDVENKCGCLTIHSNTSIYCCPFCERKKRKKKFGDADRDKFVCGTVDRGLFREIKCTKCDDIRRRVRFTNKYFCPQVGD